MSERLGRRGREEGEGGRLGDIPVKLLINNSLILLHSSTSAQASLRCAA